MRIGFIGAGLMGHGMVLGLLKAGHQVSVIAHKNRKPIEDLVSKGATEAPDLRTLAQNSDFIFLCLSGSATVLEVISSMNQHLARGQTIIDTGTSKPESTRLLAAELENRGVAFADAPLTGGPEQAARSELGVFCGASPKTFAEIEPILACFATTIRHMGPVGAGHVAKLISNFLVTGMIALVTEAFTTARNTGIDWRSLYEAMLNGSGNSGVLRKMVEPALEGDFDGYKFSLENALKDISYYADLDTDTAMAKTIELMFSTAVAQGHGRENVSQLLKPSR
jgi:3-hydroxyisobutyrate dehydrogenase-like beta-hydroxyacid dehydrogenase